MVLLSHISHIFRNFAAMSRYFITFSYDGTNYHGWQIQPNANTVQQELQRALSILLRKEIEVVGAGRTDTCLLYTSPSPRDQALSRMPSSA